MAFPLVALILAAAVLMRRNPLVPILIALGMGRRQLDVGARVKELELRSFAICAACGKKVGHVGLPLFWTVKIERYGIDMRKAARCDAFADFVGSTVIGRVMGRDEDIAYRMMEPVTVSLCEACAVGNVTIAALAEVKS